MKKGIMIFSLTTIFCGAAAISDNKHEVSAKTSSSLEEGRLNLKFSTLELEDQIFTDKKENIQPKKSIKVNERIVSDVKNEGAAKENVKVYNDNSQIKIKSEQLVKKSTEGSEKNEVKVDNKLTNKQNFLTDKKSTSKLSISTEEMHEDSILDTTNHVNTKKSEYKINIATPEQISRLSIFQIIGYIKKNKTGSKWNQLHGHYCGPGHGNTKNGPKPIDALDALCKAHDIGDEKSGYFNRKVNNEFIRGVYRDAHKMTPKVREKAYYYAEAFKRMNNTPLREAVIAGSMIVAPFKAVYASIKSTVATIASIFKPNKVAVSTRTTPRRGR